jgi:hypothetical protein
MADLPVPIANTTIPATVKIEHAAINRQTMVGAHGDDVAAQAFRDLAGELLRAG